MGAHRVNQVGTEPATSHIDLGGFEREENVRLETMSCLSSFLVELPPTGCDI